MRLIMKGKNWPHPEKNNYISWERMYITSKWVVYLAGEKNPKAGQMPWLENVFMCLFESVVHGHHIYKEVWTQEREELLVES